jgi:DNA polymerase kappa
MSMVSTANYHARKFGVRAAMPGFMAKKLCPHLVFVRPKFDKYQAAAEEVRLVFASVDANFVSRGLDEASLDATDYCAASGLTPAEVRLDLAPANTVDPCQSKKSPTTKQVNQPQ